MTYVPIPRRPLPRGRARLGPSGRTLAAREVRRLIVESEMAAAHGRCRRCDQPAVEGHEPASRGRYPGSHLDPRLVCASCRSCNEHAVLHPAEAEAEGWLLKSGLTRAEAAELTAKWKQPGRAA